MKVLISGGRKYLNAEAIRAHLALLARFAPRDTVIMHGACPTGADALTDRIARELGLLVERYPADWKKHGRAAGPIRNQQMIDEGKPDFAIVFPGGRGTADMLERLKKAKIRLTEVEPQ